MNKILKRILAVILTIIIIIWIVTILIGGYFVRYALYRNGAGGNREIKNEQVKIEEKDSDKAIINKNKKIRVLKYFFYLINSKKSDTFARLF